jgi:hypothetical protein
MYMDWAEAAGESVAFALRGVAQLVGASRALAGALERACALGAARCLAARFADARRASKRAGRAAGSPGFTERLLLVHEQHVLEVRTRRGWGGLLLNGLHGCAGRSCVRCGCGCRITWFPHRGALGLARASMDIRPRRPRRGLRPRGARRPRSRLRARQMRAHGGQDRCRLCRLC